MLLPLLIALLLVACGGAAATPTAPTGPRVVATSSELLDAGPISIPEAGQLAPDFAFTLPDGTTQKLSELRGKKVLVNFWATWCAPCRTEMPDLQQVLGEAGDGVMILGVNKGEQSDLIGPFADEVGVGFTLIPDPQASIAGRYAAINLPTTYFINSDGTIGLRKTGVMNYSFIKNHIDQLN
jgi:thiol-disulfide isomerase/thioredoxin